MDDVALKFQAKIDRFQKQIKQESSPLQWIPWVRLFMITVSFLLIYLYFRDKNAVYLLMLVISFGIFLLSGWYDFRIKGRIKRLQILISVCRSELKALSGDYSDFDPGNEFIDPAHPYSYDLDVFGKQSVFQAVNRSATIFGKARLSEYFSKAYQLKDDILLRQTAVAELSGLNHFRDELSVIFNESNTTSRDKVELEAWLTQSSGLQWLEKIKPLLYLSPAVTVGMITASLFGTIPASIPMLLCSAQLLVVFALSRRLQQVHAAVNSQVTILNRYAMALQLIARQPFKAEYLAEMQSGLNLNSMLPGNVIRKLASLLRLLDSNLNMLVAVILNGLFMFNLHIILAVEHWRKSYRELVPGWFEILAEVDALSSLGNFAFNNPDYTYPKIAGEGEFTFDAVQMGHPLISNSECVRNDLKIMGWNQFRIITGANMSGKSTFLRTVGINCILGMAGAPVCAEKLTFSPVEIHSSIRTSDSLARRESYFYAELLRLKEIVDELRSGKQKLILLDEILKGTNSTDKQAGSISLIRHLLNYRLVGLFATHDLTLGNLVTDFPENIGNLCFEISIAGEKMEISYKLSDGVCRNLNASFLMKRMNIIS